MRLTSLIVAASLFGGVPMLVGCDGRTVSHESETKTSRDGGTKTKETTVKQHDDGTVSKETETRRTNP